MRCSVRAPAEFNIHKEVIELTYNTDINDQSLGHVGSR